MKPFLLAAADIGNSGVRIGLVRDGRVLASRRLSGVGAAAASAGRAIRELLREEGFARADGAVISSVVPRRTEAMRSAIGRATGRAPLVVTPRMKSGLRLRYRTPDTLGVDRLCAAAAAYARYGGPVILVDLGTATTVDCITRSGAHLGGAIAPGIETSARALHAATAQLPMIDLTAPAGAVGRDTRSALQSGVVLGAIGGVELLVERFRRVAGRRATVVATGGFAALAASQSAVIDIINPHLVLEGAALIWRNERAKKTG